MKKTRLTWILTGILYFLPGPVLAYWPLPPTMFPEMPAGNYLQTCSSCHVDNQNILICACADRQGIPHNTTLPVSRSCGFIDNMNGQLQCTQWRNSPSPWRNPPPSSPDRYRSTRDVPVGLIWDQLNAKQICPFVCQKSQGTWTGQWKTIASGQSSVCQCRYSRY